MASEEKLLKQTLKTLKSQRDKIDRAIKSLENLVGMPEQMELGSTPKKRRKQRKGTHGKLAIQILERAGKPMKTRKILDAIANGGHKVASTSSLYPTLEREERIVKVGPGDWGLKEWEKEEGDDDIPF